MASLCTLARWPPFPSSCNAPRPPFLTVPHPPCGPSCRTWTASNSSGATTCIQLGYPVNTSASTTLTADLTDSSVPDPRIVSGLRIAGTPLATSTQTTAAACMALCWSNASCYQWSYAPATLACQFFGPSLQGVTRTWAAGYASGTAKPVTSLDASMSSPTNCTTGCNFVPNQAVLRCCLPLRAPASWGAFAWWSGARALLLTDVLSLLLLLLLLPPYSAKALSWMPPILQDFLPYSEQCGGHHPASAAHVLDVQVPEVQRQHKTFSLLVMQISSTASSTRHKPPSAASS